MSRQSLILVRTLGFIGALSLATSTAVAAQDIPPGTAVVVRTVDAIDSRNADLGKEYAAALDEDLVVSGTTLAPRGAEAVLRVAETREAGALRGRAGLTLKLVSVAIDGKWVPVDSGEVKSESGSQAARATKTGIAGAAIGAALGGILGGGSGAATGAAIGGAGGVGVAAVTGQRVQVAAETRLTFVLAGAPATAAAAPRPAPAAAAPRPAPAAAAPPPPPRPAPTPAAPPSTLTASFNQVQFEIVGAVGQGKTLTITMTALNRGVDGYVGLWGNNGYGSVVSLVDDSGSSYTAVGVTIGNQQNQSALVNDVKTSIALKFDGLSTIGGAMQATEIKRLTIAPYVGKDQRSWELGRLEFRNIPIQKQ